MCSYRTSESSFDGKTRESHQKVDGEIREIDEKFSNGLMFPGDPSGGAAEVVNCHCSLLERARWTLDEAELEYLKERAEYFGLDKAEQFEDFKKKYLKAAEDLTNNSKGVITKNGNSQLKSFTKVKVDDIPSMAEKIFNTIKGNLTKKGISVIQDANGNDYLKYMGAEAMTLSDGSAVIFQSERIPSASAVFEEIIHTTQIKVKGIVESTGDIKGTLEYLHREIEANEKLLKHKKAYSLTEKDVESVQKNLDMYYKKLKEVEQDV